MSYVAMIFGKEPESFSRTGNWGQGLRRLKVQIFLLIPQEVGKERHVAPLSEVWLSLSSSVAITEAYSLGNLHTQQKLVLLMPVSAGKGWGCSSGMFLVRVGLRQNGDMEGNRQSPGVWERDRGELHRAA